MNSLDIRQRVKTLQSLKNTTFDLVVIGGGITGAGILREACLRGLSVALLEAGDYASGTSSKSTKLIHGGIRYLQMGHVHVVREGARERKRVHELAPHLAEPQWLMLPAGNSFDYYKYRVGVSLYEYLGQVDPTNTHFNLQGADLAAMEPLLNVKRYARATVYQEYLTDDARLVIANIRAGVQASGVAANHLRVTGLIKESARLSGVRAVCGVTNEEVLVRCKGVINAAGPWVESVCQLDGLPSQKPLTLSKGIHAVVSREKLPLNQMVLLVASDGRPVFAIPRGDIVYIGTTDSKYEEAANEWPEVSEQELNYVLAPIKDYFDVQLGGQDCLSTWAGLRPLIAQTGKSTKEISRRDEIWVSKSGLITIAGGKLTGYRKMAEDTVNKAAELLRLSTGKVPLDSTLPGGSDSVGLAMRLAAVPEAGQLNSAQLTRLQRLYGSEAFSVLARGADSVVTDGQLLTGELHWAIEEEGAMSLEDVIYRRTRLAYYYPKEAEICLEAVAIRLGEILGWSAAAVNREIADVRERFRYDNRLAG